jgi:hypothetical protein
VSAVWAREVCRKETVISVKTISENEVHENREFTLVPPDDGHSCSWPFVGDEREEGSHFLTCRVNKAHSALLERDGGRDGRDLEEK